jgi:flagellar basal body-associated protein FliL
MTTAEQPPPNPPTKAEEIPLEDIEKLLEAEDPEFSKELEAVRAVENNPDVNIEATVVSEDDAAGSEDKERKESKLAKFRARLRMWLYTFRLNLKTRLKTLGKDTLIFLKTKPKEYALYAFAMSKVLVKKAGAPFRAFANAGNPQRLGILVLALFVTASLWVLLSNLRGIWIPGLNEPILGTLSEYADWVETYDPKEGAESFYSAFPQERHEFLFRKMKVNLKPGTDSPNPMGAFEVIVLLDSKDTAIEVRDREVEFFDSLQRVFEEETFNDLETDMGKNKLKSRVKRVLNQLLTQGWVKDVAFKTFILKP